MATPTQPEPFWNRLGEIARYPFRGAALISLIVLSLAGLLRLLPSVIGLFFTIVVWFAVYRYAFEILVRTAHGHLDPPEIMNHTDGGVVWRFAGLWVLYLIVFVIAVMLTGPLIGILVLLVLTLLLPGAIISLAIDDSLGQAINPATSLEIVRRIGAPYFAAFGLLFVIQVSAANAGQLLARVMPMFVAELLLMTATLWGLFATFHLMGYLVFQYHEALGFIPGEIDGKPKLRNRDGDLMDEVQDKVADGDVEAALARLREDMRERAVSLETHALYRRLLRSRNDPVALLEHAGPYLNLLLLEKKEREALAVFRECLETDPDFTPHQADDGHRLAQRALGLGQAKLAIDIWLAVLKRWPRDPAQAEWALAVAPLLAQRDRLALAREVLERCARNLDDATQQARINAALAQLPLP